MTQRMRITDIAKMTESERTEALASLVSKARSGSAAARVAVSARLRAYEIRYEMTSEEMLRQFRAGQIRETADIAKWLFLIGARDCRVSA